MKTKDKEFIQNCIENEGFDYCFVNYSSFKQIEDEEFHKLRKEYIEAAKKLENYINK